MEELAVVGGSCAVRSLDDHRAGAWAAEVALALLAGERGGARSRLEDSDPASNSIPLVGSCNGC